MKSLVARLLCVIALSASLAAQERAAALSASADALAAARRHTEAADAYAAALALQPDNLDVARRALGTFWRAARYEEGYRWGRRVLASQPDARDVLFNVGVTCGFLIERTCLESSFTRAVELYPDYAVAHGELGFLAQARGDLPGAIRHMEQAHGLAPDDDFAISGLAQMLIPAGRAQRAIALMAGRLRTNPEAPAYGGRSMLTLQGWALLESGDADGAKAAFSEVLTRLETRERAGQTTYQLFRERAAIHALRDDRAEAVAAMNAAYDRGWRLYGAWTLVDPMFRSVQDDPAVQKLLERMRADVRDQRVRLGLPAR